VVLRPRPLAREEAKSLASQDGLSRVLNRIQAEYVARISPAARFGPSCDARFLLVLKFF